MGDEEPDFFKPHPHPTKARVKNSMFDMVPDAWSEKTLTLTGDIRRVKKNTGNNLASNRCFYLILT